MVAARMAGSALAQNLSMRRAPKTLEKKLSNSTDDRSGNMKIALNNTSNQSFVGGSAGGCHSFPDYWARNGCP